MNECQFPWDDIPRPTAASIYESRKVDPFSTAEVYWTLDYQGKCGALIRFTDTWESTLRLPRLKSLTVEFRPEPESGKTVLLFILEDESLKQVFHEFCRSLTDVVFAATTASDGVKRAVNHTWLWQRFLRGQGTDMSNEEQRGLVGELTFMREYLRPQIGWHAAVACWSGPFGSPKDFQWGAHAAEVKTHLSGARPFVTISSEFQLDTDGFGDVWLFLLELLTASPEARATVALPDLVFDTRRRLAAEAPGSADDFEERLRATGYRDTHDYSDSRWLLGARKACLITPDFPSIRSSSLPSGVERVVYRIRLAAIHQRLLDPVRIFQGSGGADERA